MSAGVVAPLVGLLQHEDSNVVTPALRTLGNFVTGDDAQTQVGRASELTVVCNWRDLEVHTALAARSEHNSIQMHNTNAVLCLHVPMLLLEIFRVNDANVSSDSVPRRTTPSHKNNR